MSEVPLYGVPPEALCGGISKVNFQETLSSFGDKCPQNGSKNGHGMPPHRAFCGHESAEANKMKGSFRCLYYERDAEPPQRAPL